METGFLAICWVAEAVKMRASKLRIAQFALELDLKCYFLSLNLESSLLPPPNTRPFTSSHPLLKTLRSFATCCFDLLPTSSVLLPPTSTFLFLLHASAILNYFISWNYLLLKSNITFVFSCFLQQLWPVSTEGNMWCVNVLFYRPALDPFM